MKLRLAVIIILIGGIFCSNTISQDDSEQKKISFGSSSWSPDGQNIIFTAMMINKDYSDYSPNNWKLYNMNLESNKLSVLDEYVLYADYSQDGDKITFDKFIENNWELLVLNLKTGERTRITNNNTKEHAPSWSPDGTQIVFHSDRTGNDEIFVLNLENKRVRQITHRDTVNSYNPVWAPEGNNIVYYLEKGDHMDQIYLTDSEGSIQKNLTSDKNHNFYPGWYGKNKIIFTVGDQNVYKIKVDGTGKNLLETKSSFYSRISSNGNKLSMIDSKAQTLSVKNLKTGEVKVLVDKKLIMDFLSMK